jgi:hypothetical protein
VIRAVGPAVRTTHAQVKRTQTILARWKTGAHGKTWGVIFANASMLNRQSVGGLLQAQHELALLKTGGCALHDFGATF